jgi:hypothetical protein
VILPIKWLVYSYIRRSRQSGAGGGNLLPAGSFVHCIVRLATSIMLPSKQAGRPLKNPCPSRQKYTAVFFEIHGGVDKNTRRCIFAPPRLYINKQKINLLKKGENHGF